jgi:uncharacterized protein (TIGR03435 family)
MLRTLLEDRFKLTVHRDTRELPVYELAVAKSGLKLQPLQDGSCITPDPNGATPSPVPKQSHLCGYMGIGKGSLDATKISMANLATALSFVLARPVVDRTGVTGEFSIHLSFTPEEITPESLPPAGLDTPGASVFSAVQEQLGLRLNPSKGPVAILVIDHVEKPSENYRPARTSRPAQDYLTGEVCSFPRASVICAIVSSFAGPRAPRAARARSYSAFACSRRFSKIASAA